MAESSELIGTKYSYKWSSNKNGMESYLHNYLHSVPCLDKQNPLRLLLMVHELHKAGFQRLRIVPGMAPNGLHWRCAITPVANILRIHGAKAYEDKDIVRYTSGTDNLYFDWRDAREDTARQLAVKFVERFPEIAEKGLGPDWKYVGWFVEMLGFAERGKFPIACADWELEPDCMASDGERRLPLPPPGEAEILRQSI